MAGITDTGFIPKTYDEIRKDITDKMIAAFSIVDSTGEKTSIDISPTSRFGQLADIMSDEIRSVWEASQAIYDTRYPDNASGINLDNVAAITNTQRKPAIASNVSCLALSDNPNVTIPSGQAVSKNIVGDIEQFVNTVDLVIGSNVICLLPNDLCDEGYLELSFQGEIATDGQTYITNPDADPADQITAPVRTVFNYDDNPLVWKDKLENLVVNGDKVITDVTVEGSFKEDGYVLLYINETTLSILKPAIVENTLERYNIKQDCFAYYSTDSAVTFQGQDTTGIPIPALTVRKVISSNTSFNAVINPLTGTPGVPRESDADFRIRRQKELQSVGQVTPGGVKATVSAIPGVTDVFLIENDTSSVDSKGRPPHSYEVYCNCSEDLEPVVGQAIYDAKPVGIRAYSSAVPSAKVEAPIKDVNNNDAIIEFSRPTGLLFYVYIELEKTEFFPSDGNEQIKNNLIKHYQDTYKLNDVGYNKTVYIHSLFSPVNSVGGVGRCIIKHLDSAPADPNDQASYTLDPLDIPIDMFGMVTADSIVIKEV